MTGEREIRGKVLVGDDARSRGFTSGNAYDEQAPQVIWVAKDRRHRDRRVLRVFLKPDGWHVLIDSFTTDLTRGAAAYGVTETQAREMLFDNVRRLEGTEHVCPLAVDEWPTARFELGHHGRTAWFDLDVLGQDCRTFKQTRRPVRRTVEFDAW